MEHRSDRFLPHTIKSVPKDNFSLDVGSDQVCFRWMETNRVQAAAVLVRQHLQYRADHHISINEGFWMAWTDLLGADAVNAQFVAGRENQCIALRGKGKVLQRLHRKQGIANLEGAGANSHEKIVKDRAGVRTKARFGQHQNPLWSYGRQRTGWRDPTRAECSSRRLQAE